MNAAGRAAWLGAKQHGVVSRAELRASGVTEARARRLVRDGVLVRVASGVFRWQGAPATWEQQAMIAVKASGAGALLSHQSGAALHRLAGFRRGSLHVVVPIDVVRSGPRWTTHRARLSPDDRCVVDGIPVVRVSLVLVQVAGLVSLRRLEDAFDDALCRRLIDLDDVTDACRRGRPGAAALRQVAALWQPGDRPDTLAEARLVRRLRAFGLPHPALQYEVVDGGELIARADLAFPGHRVVIEYDSFRWHETRRSRAATQARRNRLEAAGWHVLVATEADRADGGAQLAATAARLIGTPAQP